MNHSLNHQTEMRQNQIGFKLAAHLSNASTDLPYEVSERLRAARVQAVAKRKMATTRSAAAVVSTGGSAALLFGDEGQSWWNRLVSAVPLVVLAVGLVSINMVQNESRADEVAEVDSALLTDDLPPSAYADPGFVHFLKSGQDSAQ